MGVSARLARSHITWLCWTKSIALISLRIPSANCMRAAAGAAMVMVRPISR